MPRPHAFQDLKITNCWPNDPEVFERFTALYGTGNVNCQEELGADVIESVLGPAPKTPLNDASVGEWSPRETLQICLLNLDIFRTPDESHMNDTKMEPYKEYPCQNRQKLIRVLAQDLERLYERAMEQCHHRAVQRLRHWQNMALEVERYEKEYNKLNRRRVFKGREHPPPKELKRAVDTIKRAVSAHNPGDFQRSDEQLNIRNQLVDGLFMAFSEHGPEGWPDDTIIHAVQSIMQAFDIPTPTTRRALLYQLDVIRSERSEQK